MAMSDREVPELELPKIAFCPGKHKAKNYIFVMKIYSFAGFKPGSMRGGKVAKADGPAPQVT